MPSPSSRLATVLLPVRWPNLVLCVCVAFAFLAVAPLSVSAEPSNQDLTVSTFNSAAFADYVAIADALVTFKTNPSDKPAVSGLVDAQSKLGATVLENIEKIWPIHCSDGCARDTTPVVEKIDRARHIYRTKETDRKTQAKLTIGLRKALSEYDVATKSSFVPDDQRALHNSDKEVDAAKVWSSSARRVAESVKKNNVSYVKLVESWNKAAVEGNSKTTADAEKFLTVLDVWASEFVPDGSNAGRTAVYKYADDLWKEGIAPFYQSLQCHVRAILSKTRKSVSSDGTFPIHAIRSINGDSWPAAYGLLRKDSRKNVPTLNLDEKLKTKKLEDLITIIDSFYKTLVGDKWTPPLLSVADITVTRTVSGKSASDCLPELIDLGLTAAKPADALTPRGFKIVTCWADGTPTTDEFYELFELYGRAVYQQVTSSNGVHFLFHGPASPSFAVAFSSLARLSLTPSWLLKQGLLPDKYDASTSESLFEHYLLIMLDTLPRAAAAYADLKWFQAVATGEIKTDKELNDKFWSLKRSIMGIVPSEKLPSKDKFYPVLSRRIALGLNPLADLFGTIQKLKLHSNLCVTQDSKFSLNCTLNKRNDDLSNLLSQGSLLSPLSILTGEKDTQSTITSTFGIGDANELLKVYFDAQDRYATANSHKAYCQWNQNGPKMEDFSPPATWPVFIGVVAILGLMMAAAYRMYQSGDRDTPSYYGYDDGL